MIAATEFKAKCLNLLDHVHETGEELIISKHGRPVAKLVAITTEKTWKKLEGTGEFIGDPFSPVIADSDLDVLQ